MRNLHVIFVLSLMLSGCSSETLPEGMPPLFPAKLTFTQEGKALGDAAVALMNTEPSMMRWTVGGRTDSNGVLTVKTLGKYNGVPAGKYIILVTKTERFAGGTEKQPVPQDDKAAKEYYAKINKEQKFFDYVDLKYSAPETSGLEIEISPDGNEQTFDLGKAVKIEKKPLM